MTSRAILATALLLSAASAHAADHIYRIESAAFVAYSGTRSLPAVQAPDGSSVTPFQAPAGALGNVGEPGFNRDGAATGFYVGPNQLDTWEGFYEYLGGDHNARLCVNHIPTGTPQHQCIYFDGATGTFASADPAVVAYSIAPLAAHPNWFHVSMTFQTAANLPANTEAFVYVQTRPGQRFALGRWKLTTGQAP